MRGTTAAALLLAACAGPPPTAYDGRRQDIPLGQNAAGEACSQAENEAGREYLIYCGSWTQPSATIRRGPAAAGADLVALATGGAWRQHIDGFLSCGAPKHIEILGGPAELLSCTRRQEGFPQTAFVTLVNGYAWFADGVPPANPVMERAIGLNAGLIHANSLGTMQESAGLQAERLARRAESAGDMAAYRELRRTATLANLAGEYAGAETAYRSIVNLQSRVLGQNDPALASGLALEALMISNQGRFAEATTMLARAESLARHDEADATALAEVWHYQGLNLLNQRQPAAALVLLRRAEAAYLPLAPDGTTTASAADGLMPMDPTTRAAAYGVVEARRAEAVAYRMMDQPAESRGAAITASRVAAAYALNNVEALARLSRTEATALQAAGQDDQSLAAIRRAASGFAKVLPGTRAFAQTQLLLAARLAHDGESSQALATCRSAGDVLRNAHAGIGADALMPCLALLAPAAEGGDQAAARDMFLLAGQAQGNTTSQQIALVSARLAENARDPRVAKLIRDRDDANAALTQLYAQRADIDPSATTPAARDAMAKQIAAAQQRRDSLEQALQAASPNYAQLLQQAVSADDILHALRPREVFSDIVLAPAGGYNFLFAGGRITVVGIAGGAARVDKLVARIRHPMDNFAGGTLAPFDTAAAAELYAALFGDDAKLLDGAEALSVAPSGALLSLPFGLLLTGPANPDQLGAAPFLVNRVAIAHVPAAASFVQLRKVAGTSRATEPWFGFGDFRPVTRAQANATYPPAMCRDSAALFAGLPPLPGATKELALARGLLGGSDADELLGTRFTAAAVETQSLKDYRVLHFATHAILQTDLACQVEPALVTSAPANAGDAQGALLTASEVAGLKLDANVVLLSACNSGGPGGSAPGESLSGLARSFFYAGARSLLVTHWDVNDRVTSVLVGATLDYARKTPLLGMAAALAAAQRRLLEKARTDLPELAHPYYWAPLALIGEGRAVTANSVVSLNQPK